MYFATLENRNDKIAHSLLPSLYLINVSDWEFKGAKLIREYDNRTVNQAKDAEGLLYVTLVTKRSGEQRTGTVCADGFNKQAARLFCQNMSYQVEEGSWGTHEDYRYVLK